MGETTNDLQTLRAACNALWPLLRKRHWETAKKTRAISPTGNPRGHNYAPGQIPGPEPTIEVIDHIRYLEATAHSTETRLGYGIAIELTRVDAERALSLMPAAAAAEYDEALHNRELRFQHPFTWETDRYRRNRALPRRAAIALQAVAAAATVRILTPEENAALIDDGGINAQAVFAAVDRTTESEC